MSEANGNGQLGQIVSWKVPSSVPLNVLRQSLRTAGLGEELAADMAPRNALCRALREMKQGRVIRQLRRDGDVLWFQFTAEHLSAREVTYNKEAELSLDVNTGSVWCSVPELAYEAQSLLQEHQAKRLTSDLTRLVQRVFDSRRADLIPIREQGGAYFVPDMHSEIVAKVRTLLDAIGGGLRTFAVRLGSGDTNAAVAESLSEYLTDLIKEFRESCAEVTGDSRKNVIENRQGRVKELRQKLACYQGLLTSYATSIRQQITEAESALLRNLAKTTDGEATTPAPVTNHREQVLDLLQA